MENIKDARSKEIDSKKIEDERLERISENKEVVAYMKVSWKNPGREGVSQRRVVNPLLWRRWKR